MDLTSVELEAGSTLSLKYTINTETLISWRFRLDKGSINFGIKRKEATRNFTPRYEVRELSLYKTNLSQSLHVPASQA